MRYITIYAKSATAAKKIKWIETLMPFFWLLMALIAILPTYIKTGQIDKQLYPVGAMILIGGVVSTLVIRYKFRQLMNTVFEINEIGIQDMTPGREKTLRWIDMTTAKWIQVNRNQKGLQIKTNDAKMIIWQPLVPETEDGSTIKNTLRGFKVNYPDGREETIRIENSYPVRELQKYRPDLTKTLFNNPVKKFLSKIFSQE